MKKLLFIGLLILIVTTVNSQITLKGIAVQYINPYKKGDTINVYGSKENMATKYNQFFIDGGGYAKKYVNSTKIELINPNLSFWEEVWFKNRGAEIAISGWEENHRQELYNSAVDYYYNAEKNYLIYEDELLYDYIYQLILKIHPEKLIKPIPSCFGVIIIKSNEPDYFSFDNGFIVLTTGLIAQTRNEKELIEILAQSISHVVLEHNLLNLKQQIKSEKISEAWGTIATVAASVAMANSNNKNYTNYNFADAVDLGLSAYFLSNSIMESIGANYSYNQNTNAINIAKEYMNQINGNKTLSDEEYIKKISRVISFSSWQEYNLMNYEYSFELVNILHQNNLATEKDFLLLSKLYRATSNTKELNLKALELIKQAKEIGLTNLVDLDKESGILYLRLNDYDNAKDCFIRYKNALYELEKQGADISDELEYLNQLLYTNNLLN